MKYIYLFTLVCFCNLLFSQNNNPTIAPCDGKQTVCDTGQTFKLCINIVINPSYLYLNNISSYDIDWGDGTPVINIPTNGGQTQPPQYHIYDLSNFYGTCQDKKTYYVTLLTNHTPSTISQTNSIFLLTIKNPPIAGITISDQVICVGDITNISDYSCLAGMQDSNWDFGDGTKLYNILSTTHSYNMAGTYIVKHSVMNECGSDDATKTINVITPPIADIKIDSGAIAGTPPIVCLGGGGLVKLDASISLNENSYSWTVNPPNGWQWWPKPSPSPIIAKPYIKFTQPGTYTIKVKVDNDCNKPSEKSIDIKVVQAPILNLIPQPDACISLSYSPNPDDMNAIYKINGSVKNSFPIVLSSSNMPYTVEATLTNECGMQIRRDTFWVLDPVPVSIKFPTKDTVICQFTDTLTLAAIPSGGTWQGQNLKNIGGKEVFIPSSTGTFPIIYIRGSGNCERRDTVKIKVEEGYNLQLSPQPDDCSSINYTPNPNDSKVNYTLNGATVTQFPQILPVSNNPYIVTVSHTNVCGTKILSDTFYVFAPTPVSIISPKDTLICQFSDTLTLIANPLGGNWQGQNTIGSSGNQLFIPITAGTFPIIYIRGTGNCERRDTIQIKVVEDYKLELFGQPDDCISLNYTPMPNDKNVTYTLNGVNQTQFPQTLTESTNPYIISASHTNVCGTKILTDTFYVLSPTPVNILAPNDTVICQNSGALSLVAEPTGGKWEGVSISGNIFTPSTGGTFPLIYIRGTGNCEKRDTALVKVIGVDINAGIDQSICLLDPPFLLSNFKPATGGSWSGKGITNSNGNFDPIISGIGDQVLVYQYKDPLLGCAFSDSLIIAVHPMPESNFPKPASACINEVIQFENLSKDTFKVVWDFGDGNISTFPKPMHTYKDTGSYTIKLTTTTKFSCTDMYTQTIFVTEPPHAFFTSSPDTGCAVLPVAVQNESYGWQTKYIWNLGSSKIDSIFNPKPILLPGGTKDTTFIITLTATNLCASKIWSDSIFVHPLPIVKIGTNTDTICSGEIIHFANNTLGQPETFLWDFGNGKTSTDSIAPPMQYFTDSLYHNYSIQLIATNFCGSDTAQYNFTIKPVEVKAFFNVPNLIGCQPYLVHFTNYATPGAKVSWQFGDLNTSSELNPIHIYDLPGTYKVIQKASDGCGYDSIIGYIKVLPAPKVSFTSLKQVCLGDTMFFYNSSTDILSGVHWDFGDGDTSNLYNSYHIFSNAGIKTITLTGISADNFCSAQFNFPIKVLELPIVDFTPDKQDGCLPLTVNFLNKSQNAIYYEWDFGDGNTSKDLTPTHIYNIAGQYEVKLNAFDINNCHNDTFIDYITAHPLPNPLFELDRDHLCGIPVKVDFSNKTLDATGYKWNFGDGSPLNIDNNPLHTYSNSGDFIVQLSAENIFGCLDTLSQIFSAYAQPKANLSIDPYKGCSPLAVLFTNLSTNTTTANWTFSDGIKSDSLNAITHVFYDAGKQGVSIIASYKNVCFDTLTYNDTISVMQSPTANFSFEEKITSPPSAMFQFIDHSTNAISWHWEFGDGGTSDLQNPEHRYYSNGDKYVKLTVIGENDCPDDTTLIITPTFIHGLFIPNAFTPSLSNGKASTFFPTGVGLKEYEIAVYSSYGQLLWSSQELSNGQPVGFWNGTYKGDQMPQDVYTWQVKKAIFEDGSSWNEKRVGSVTLIR